jgi:serine/threonine protein kinase
MHVIQPVNRKTTKALADFESVNFFSKLPAKDLIRGLLNTNPDKRLTIHEVLRSKWITVRMDFSFIVIK